VAVVQKLTAFAGSPAVPTLGTAHYPLQLGKSDRRQSLLIMSHSADLWMVLLSVIVILTIGAFCLKRNGLDGRCQWFLEGTLLTFLGLNVLVFGGFLIGLIGLAWLKVVSPFWMFWELAYLFSAIAVYQVFPFICVSLILWSCCGRAFLSYPSRFIGMSFLAAAVVVVNICVDLLLNNSFR
jgi:hypothetical protein